MRVKFKTECGNVCYAPPEATKPMENGREMVWCKTNTGEIKPAYMQS